MGHLDKRLIEKKGLVGVINAPFLESVEKTQTKNARVRQILYNDKFNGIRNCWISNSYRQVNNSIGFKKCPICTHNSRAKIWLN